jgi:hypothetical protein
VASLLESGQILLDELERRELEPAARSLRDSGIDLPELAEPIALVDYWSLELRNAMLLGDLEFVEWALQRLTDESKNRGQPN